MLYLKDIFKGWSTEVHAILGITKDNDIKNRDMHERPLSFITSWTYAGSVDLIGDSVHAMMPVSFPSPPPKKYDLFSKLSVPCFGDLYIILGLFFIFYASLLPSIDTLSPFKHITYVREDFSPSRTRMCWPTRYDWQPNDPT